MPKSLKTIAGQYQNDNSCDKVVEGQVRKTTKDRMMNKYPYFITNILNLTEQRGVSRRFLHFIHRIFCPFKFTGGLAPCRSDEIKSGSHFLSIPYEFICRCLNSCESSYRRYLSPSIILNKMVMRYQISLPDAMMIL